ncbi:alpha-2,8-sialyltransferase 8B-like [Antedon mediterranea]|uniref:alpha-2,8-sialyltransferase 8B-like n=1 Tax=Antedon mediterranea TaxID=105859 RepID=UPI003AF8014C
MVSKTRWRQVGILMCASFSLYVVLSYQQTYTKTCKRLCNTLNECFKINQAVLIYNNDVDEKKMSFKQNQMPELSPFQYITEFLSGSFNKRDCLLNSYFSDIQLPTMQHTCAIVASGGILRGSNCGDEINRHDFVFRANLAPIQGYTADVGYKTNITMLNLESLARIYRNFTEKTSDSHVVEDMILNRIRFLNDSILWFGKSMQRQDAKIKLKKVIEVIRKKHNLPVRVAYSWKSISIERYWKLLHHATTGFNMYAVAAQICDNIALYGFYPYSELDDGSHIQHHYYGDLKHFFYRSHVHNMPLEFSKLQNDAMTKDNVRLITKPCK